MITSIRPKDWRDLQIQVARLLTECGFDVNIELVLKNARGHIEIDVFAKEIINGRTYSIACECKNWNSNVPQSTIHGFRTAIADIGVNLGIVITTSNYQSGAIEASQFTNIQLHTWETFQLEFEKQWLEMYFHPKITTELDPLFTYTEPLAPAWYPKLTSADKQIFSKLQNQYLGFGLFMLSLARWGGFMEKNGLTLPLEQALIQKYKLSELPSEILAAQCYRDFLEPCLSYGGQAITQFREIRDKYYLSTDHAED